jgi:type I restriction enzyme S subunit
MRNRHGDRWQRLQVGQFAEVQTGGTPSRSEATYWHGGTIPWVTTAEVNYRSIYSTKERITDIGLRNSAAKIFPKGTLLMAMYGQGKTRGQVARLAVEAATNQACAALIPDSRVAVDYLYYYLEFSYQNLRKLSNVGGQENLSKSLIESFDVPFPSCTAEQHCIADILQTWDDAILKNDRLIAAKAVAFDLWSYTLLTGRRRLGRKRTNWLSVSLTEVTFEATARNKEGQLGVDAVMGVNKQLGMIPMKDHVRAADLSRYKIVRPGAFAYNPMRLNIGSIAQNDHGRDVLVSPDYVAFETDPDVLLPAYFDHLRRTSIWSRFVRTAGSGGVRVRIYYENLGDFVLELPPIEEQARIVEALDTGRREIAILEQQRDALVKQKRGLMQKLLTGEWPVRAPKSREAAE